jgi:hypothetical protein
MGMTKKQREKQRIYLAKLKALEKKLLKKKGD